MFPDNIASKDPITGFIQWLMSINVEFAMRVLVLGLIALWLVMLWWFWLDSVSRYSNSVIQLVMGFLVVFVPVVGLLIYLIIRPRRTLQENYFSDLEHKFLLAEVDSISVCEKCGDVSTKNDKYCQVCGAQLKKKCEKCGKELSVRSAFCKNCGTKQPVESIQEPDLIKPRFKLAEKMKRFQDVIKNIVNNLLKQLGDFLRKFFKNTRNKPVESKSNLKKEPMKPKATKNKGSVKSKSNLKGKKK
ncbi:zinc ribbon domain-containing protein [Candidatus Dojkabacteria bacterium]|nr:zinc ribbon domain-containing protein [Candidatus Dojkabacteria bacterium]